MLKKLVNRLVRPLKISLVSDWEKSIGSVTSFEERRSTWLADKNVSIVLDIGANTGQYARSILSRGYGGRIVSFEPLNKEYRVLSQLSESFRNWETRNFALGDCKSEAVINIAGNSQSSSLLPMLERHRIALPSSSYRGEEVVHVERLDSIWDSIVRPSDVVWLKLDVQGAEKGVLDGLGSIPKQVMAIELELSFVDLYEGQTPMIPLLQRLESEGFALVATEDAFRDEATQETLQMDGIFFRH